VVKRFSGGSLKEEITPPETFPKIKNATKIYTSKDNKYLYLLEPDEKRVIVTDKKGNIVAEYQSEKFENLKDLWASPDDKFIYLLDGRKVFRIETKTK
jgi:DNA-binding beta-propeller fold protein YncE